MHPYRKASGWFIALLSTVATLIVSYAGPAHAVIDTSACKISNLPTPAFWAQRGPSGAGFPGPFVQYQVTNGAGTFAGMAYTHDSSGPIIRIIRYSGGKVTVLDTLSYSNVAFTPIDSSVRVIGIDSWGNVVARVQPTDQSGSRYVAYRYSPSGQRTKLQDSPLWASFEPVGIASSGTVYGTARYGLPYSGNDRVVSWTGPGRGAVHVLTGPGNVTEAVDLNGDVYYRYNGETPYVRQASGQVNKVMGFDSGQPATNAFFTGASTSSGYGMSSTYSNTQLGTRWDGAAAKAGDLVYGRRVSNFVWISAVGKNGDIVGDFPGNSAPDRGTRVLVRSSGKAYRLPAQLQPSKYDDEPRPAVNGYGQVVYTGSDALAHVLTCPS